MKKIKYYFISGLCLLMLSCLLVGCGLKGIALYYIVDGDIYQKGYIEANGEITLPEVEKPGYTFLGWYYNDTLLQTDTFKNNTPTTSVMIYSQWEAKSYKLTFNLDGGTLGDYNTTYQYAPVDQALPIPTKAGYDFVGWSRVDRSTDVLFTTIPAGTYGDLTYVAHWNVGTYTLSFDTRGGNSIASKSYSLGDTITLPTPTKTNCVFNGWYTSLSFDEPFDKNQPLTHDTTIYAAWTSSANYLLSYRDNIDNTEDQISGNKANDELVCYGETVTLNTPYYLNSYIFTGWYNGNTCVTLNNNVSFTMSERTTLVAQYTMINHLYSVNLNDEMALAINLNSITDNSQLLGSDFTKTDYKADDSVLTINYTALNRQDLGYVNVLIDKTPITLYIYNSDGAAHNLVLNYDRCFPEVCLDYEGTGDYDVSINGSAFVPAYSGIILTGYDKSISNTVTLREKNTHVETTMTKAGYSAQAKTYYTTSFNAQGQTYDYVMESVEEFQIFLEYLTGVLMPVNSYVSDYTIKVWCCDDLCEDQSSSIFDAVYSNYSQSYAASVAHRGGNSATPVLTLVCNSKSNFNDQTSTQAVNDLTDKQGLLTKNTTTRSHLPIDNNTVSEEILTLYELENLSVGVKPIIKDESSQAGQVYAMARSICSQYINDEMNDFEKVTAFYNYLGLYVNYDYVVAKMEDETGSGYTAYTSYGALIDHRAVCDGYASALKLLCLIENIECMEIVGMSGETGHAWNKVKIDGAWWGVDSTWSRKDNYVTHAYLFLSEADLISSNHKEDSYTNRCDTTIASGLVNYYQLTSTDTNGHTLYTDSSDDLAAALKYAKAHNIKVLEVAYAGSNFSSELNIASVFSGVKVVGSGSLATTLGYVVEYITLG